MRALERFHSREHIERDKVVPVQSTRQRSYPRGGRPLLGSPTPRHESFEAVKVCLLGRVPRKKEVQEMNRRHCRQTRRIRVIHIQKMRQYNRRHILGNGAVEQN